MQTKQLIGELFPGAAIVVHPDHFQGILDAFNSADPPAFGMVLVSEENYLKRYKEALYYKMKYHIPVLYEDQDQIMIEMPEPTICSLLPVEIFEYIDRIKKPSVN